MVLESSRTLPPLRQAQGSASEASGTFPHPREGAAYTRRLLPELNHTSTLFGTWSLNEDIGALWNLFYHQRPARIFSRDWKCILRSWIVMLSEMLHDKSNKCLDHIVALASGCCELLQLLLVRFYKADLRFRWCPLLTKQSHPSALGNLGHLPSSEGRSHVPAKTSCWIESYTYAF